ncbi:hypothetical protein VNO80_03607 [Phaseolus coccineus]|uniref:Uncharacterized protein n=1 Tax=Phaseolus coccineus TaxID=3886 RepID=A0AAN9RJ05_PHACN
MKVAAQPATNTTPTTEATTAATRNTTAACCAPTQASRAQIAHHCSCRRTVPPEVAQVAHTMSSIRVARRRPPHRVAHVTLSCTQGRRIKVSV